MWKKICAKRLFWRLSEFKKVLHETIILQSSSVKFLKTIGKSDHFDFVKVENIFAVYSIFFCRIFVMAFFVMVFLQWCFGFCGFFVFVVGALVFLWYVFCGSVFVLLLGSYSGVSSKRWSKIWGYHFGRRRRTKTAFDEALSSPNIVGTTTSTSRKFDKSPWQFPSLR